MHAITYTHDYIHVTVRCVPFGHALLQLVNGSGIFKTTYFLGGGRGSRPRATRSSLSFSHILHSSRHLFTSSVDAPLGNLTVTQLFTNDDAHSTQKLLPR